MDRRVLLNLSVLVLVLLAGCAGLVSTDDSNTPYAGHGSVDFELWIVNEGETTENITVRYRFEGSSVHAFNTTVTLSPGEETREDIEFRKTGRYIVRATTDAGGSTTYEYEVRTRNPVDAVYIGIDEGEVDSTLYTT